MPESLVQDGGHLAAPGPLPKTPRSDFCGMQPQTNVQEMASNLAEWRQRAKQAMEGAEEPGGRRPPRRGPMAQASSSGPSEEERRQRAEHLRQQRDALIAKRNADREQKIDELPARRGRHAADMTFATAEERRAAGSGKLPPPAAGPQAADCRADAQSGRARRRPAARRGGRGRPDAPGAHRAAAADAVPLHGERRGAPARRDQPAAHAQEAGCCTMTCCDGPVAESAFLFFRSPPRYFSVYRSRCPSPREGAGRSVRGER
ncbi:unnamed protein product [Prorocentrum cordatum]|uniref:Uncharacterized protein n=1 Tax=Prorocentrum cordatum TaxID=2364126 RepID=A0ABN9XU13_9DINO|nr:unnamed protein product [Polarella glacialis]